ncbi:MAG TPA: hypothetical protein VJL54_06395 [Nitrososphaera sp.]|nr:hypothetical protein [Nitrososphaera sp.]
MVVEEVRYDFEDHPRYADDFVRDLARLMIIAKLNAAARNATSKEYFLRIISQIEGCEAYVVKYGQPLLYAKYRGMEFTDQKVTSQFARSGNVVDVTMESVFGEFVKRFDTLASTSDSKVKWGVAAKDDKPDPLFALLNSFVDAVAMLTALGVSSADSIAGKRFGIRNASIAKKSMHLEFTIDGQLNILELNPAKKRKDDAIQVLFAKSDIASSISALMKQA